MLCLSFLSFAHTPSPLLPPDYLPDLITNGNQWVMTAYRDNRKEHDEVVTHTFCFYKNTSQSFIGTHQHYVWYSTTFHDWNGHAVQEGDEIFMHGSAPYEGAGIYRPSYDSMEWEIVTKAGKGKKSYTLGAGHWRNWEEEDGKFGKSNGFLSITFERTGKSCKAINHINDVIVLSQAIPKNHSSIKKAPMPKSIEVKKF